MDSSFIHKGGVSVVIPAYNYARYLPFAIDSALQQTVSPLEIIVVDDGSKDDTREVVARYGERVRYIYQTNAGLPAARNTGIKNALGEFIGFLDADDQWTPDFLARVRQQFAELPPEHGLVATLCHYVDMEGKRIPTKPPSLAVQGLLTHRDILFKTRFSPSSVVARKSALEDSGLFDVSLRSSEDRDMWIRIGVNHALYLIPEQLTLIRRHNANMSRNAGRMKQNILRVIEKSKAAQLVPASEWKFWLPVRSFVSFQSAWMYYEQGSRGRAVLELLISMLIWPWFSHPERLNEPVLYRLRTLRHFLFLKPA